jgi:D-sedoheptulose 7-phosphate isomerase
MGMSHAPNCNISEKLSDVCSCGFDHAETFYGALSRALTDCALPAHEAMVRELAALRERGGRLFCLGVGGGAANAAHAVNDFRKLCGIEAYAPTDGVAELTARANDEGWQTIFYEWLHVSRLCGFDALMVFSVGGGTPEISQCIHEAVEYAWARGAPVLGIVGSREGTTARLGRAVAVVEAEGALRTPVTEAAQIAVLHALVSDPRLQINKTKW